MIKKNLKKAFTLVELLVVIAIMAILSTVSVGGYFIFNHQSSLNSDVSTLNQLNEYKDSFKMKHLHEFMNGIKTPHDLIRSIEDEGNTSSYNCNTKGYYFVLNFETIEFALVDEFDKPIKGNLSETPYLNYRFISKEIEKNAQRKNFSLYLNDDFNSLNYSVHLYDQCFDAGNSQDLKEVIYTNSSNKLDQNGNSVAKEIIINTNSYKTNIRIERNNRELYVDDHIRTYGKANFIEQVANKLTNCGHAFRINHLLNDYENFFDDEAGKLHEIALNKECCFEEGLTEAGSKIYTDRNHAYVVCAECGRCFDSEWHHHNSDESLPFYDLKNNNFRCVHDFISSSDVQKVSCEEAHYHGECKLCNSNYDFEGIGLGHDFGDSFSCLRCGAHKDIVAYNKDDLTEYFLTVDKFVANLNSATDKNYVLYKDIELPNYVDLNRACNIKINLNGFKIRRNGTLFVVSNDDAKLTLESDIALSDDKDPNKDRSKGTIYGGETAIIVSNGTFSASKIIFYGKAIAIANMNAGHVNLDNCKVYSTMEIADYKAGSDNIYEKYVYCAIVNYGNLVTDNDCDIRCKPMFFKNNQYDNGTNSDIFYYYKSYGIRNFATGRFNLNKTTVEGSSFAFLCESNAFDECSISNSTFLHPFVDRIYYSHVDKVEFAKSTIEFITTSQEQSKKYPTITNCNIYEFDLNVKGINYNSQELDTQVSKKKFTEQTNNTTGVKFFLVENDEDGEDYYNRNVSSVS